MENALSLANLAAAERKVHSQNGEDGVIAALFAALGTTNRHFVEFGVEDGTECNCAKLLDEGWTGLMMDGEGISKNPLIQVRKERVTAENVNELFAKYEVPREFDLLSIDIDGNDYWVWKALEYRPQVVVIEYNASVPPHLRRVIPYDPRFMWNGSDYFGASLRALAELGASKGYELVYCETIGANAFFVAKAALPSGHRSRSVEETHRPPNYFGMGIGHRPESWRVMIDPEGPPLFNRAVGLHQGGNPIRAKEFYLRFLHDEPNNAEAICLLGLAEQSTGRCDEAIALLRQAERLTSSSMARVAYGLGCAFRDRGDLTDALKWYLEATRREPRCSDAFAGAGLILKNLGRWNEAIENFHAALHVNPADGGSATNLGNVLRHLGQLDEAVSWHRHALSFHPRYAVAAGNLGIALNQQGMTAEAIDSFREAVRLDPRSANGFNNLGIALRRAGRLDEAADCFREAIRLDPNHAGARDNLGELS